MILLTWEQSVFLRAVQEVSAELGDHVYDAIQGGASIDDVKAQLARCMTAAASVEG